MLNGEWVQVSPQRLTRPWQGTVEKLKQPDRPHHDPSCYLCPGNVRAAGHRNPFYSGVFVFDNDYPAIGNEWRPVSEEQGGHLFEASASTGTCRVVCFSPRHDLTLTELTADAMLRVVETWVQQTAELGERHQWVQIFENKGRMMGASNAHPHGQIFAVDFLPHEPQLEDVRQREYFGQHQRPLLQDYAQAEGDVGSRVVVENEHWLALVPYWAMWPYETLLLPRRHVLRLSEITSAEQKSLTRIIHPLLAAYDRLFDTPFPYTMGWHGAPFVGEAQDHWQLHAHYYPPLLRSATVRKFMVGYEMLGEPLRDLTPEQAAAQLQELIHPKEKSQI